MRCEQGDGVNTVRCVFLYGRYAHTRQVAGMHIPAVWSLCPPLPCGRCPGPRGRCPVSPAWRLFGVPVWPLFGVPVWPEFSVPVWPEFCVPVCARGFEFRVPVCVA